MKIVVGSAFRDMAGRLAPYFAQIVALREYVRLNDANAVVRVIAVEGDSRDKTRRALTQAAIRYRLDLDLRTHNHGHPPFGSTERPERLAALTDVLHVGLDAVEERDDVLVWVECDLAWSPRSVLGLIRMALSLDAVCAPMVWAGEAFYDVWAFRGLDGCRFSPSPPFHSDYQPGRPLELSSAGSCLAMPGHVARQVRSEGREALVSWCASARRLGHRVFLAPEFEVRQA